MNNEQFRKLVSGASGKDGSADSKSHQPASSLGSRQRITQRNTQGPDYSFARPGAASKQSKTFKSFAPRGIKLGSGYSDRTQARVDESEDDKAKRIKALEESVKAGDLSQEDFEKMRDSITGGEVENTHLVKGLDWKLLRRIKDGENVTTKASESKEGDAVEDEDVLDELDSLEKQEVKAVSKTETEKKGTLAPLAKIASKRTRDEILAELKASRKRAAEASAPQLGSKFRKIGDGDRIKPQKVDKKSKPKDVEPEKLEETLNLVPLDHDVVVPELAPPPESESDDDIYADIADTYNPLGNMDDEESEEETQEKPKTAPAPKESTDPSQQLPRRKIFEDESTSVLSKMSDAKNDQALIAAIARSRKEEESKEPEPPTTEEQARLKRRAEMLSQVDRDLEDMDMGFGSSRFDDADEMAMETSKVKLSEWKGGKEDDEDEDGDGKGAKGGKGKKRDRKPKKKKGDKNSMADVMAVIAGRKS